MNNPLIRILVLGLLLMALVSPFSALAVLMTFLFVVAALWTVWGLVQAAAGDHDASS